MANNILVELAVDSPGDCPVAQASDEIGPAITDVARSTSPGPDGEFVEEFTLPGERSLGNPQVDLVFDAESHTVYQFSHDDAACICRTIESFGCPISTITARNGSLYVSFYTPGIETVRDIVTALQDEFGSISVHQLAHDDDDRGDTDLALVDRSQLTERQRDVLETAYEMGYFEHPKRANAGDVAEELDIAISTFSEHLAAAQRKVLDELLRP